MALVLVSHDMGIIAETCDRVAVMYAGRIVELAPTAALFAAPGPSLYARGCSARSRGLDAGAGRARRRSPASRPTWRSLPPGCPFAERCAAGHGRMPPRADRAAANRARPRCAACLYPGAGRRARLERGMTAAAHRSLEIDELVVQFRQARSAVDLALWPRARPSVRAVDGVVADGRAGRDAGAGGRERQRQDHDRPRRPGAASAEPPAASASRARMSAGLDARRPPAIPAAGPDGVPGPLFLAQSPKLPVGSAIAEVLRFHQHRAGGGGAMPRSGACWASSGCMPDMVRPPAAQPQRRPAPARRACPGARRPARPSSFSTSPSRRSTSRSRPRC